MQSNHQLENQPLDNEAFAKFFDQDQRLINEHEFRKVIFKGGIKEDTRVEAWKFLFQYYPYNSTPRERHNHDIVSFIDYSIMKLRWHKIYDFCKNLPVTTVNKISSPNLSFDINLNVPNNEEYSKANIDSLKIQSILKISRQSIDNKMLLDDIIQIDKDVPRTSLFNDTNIDEIFRFNLRNILITFSAYHQNVNSNSSNKKVNNLGYTQGMNELASIFLWVFKNESKAYWCFSNFMLLDLHTTNGITLNTVEIEATNALKTNNAHYFSDTGIGHKLKQLVILLKFTDNELYARLEEYNLEKLYFCHEWLLLFFKRLFKQASHLYLECFEKLSSHFVELNVALMSTTLDKRQININALYTFDLFICLALLKQLRNSLMDREKCTNEIDVYNIIRVETSDLFIREFKSIFNIGENLFHTYCISQMSLLTVNDTNMKKTKKFDNIYEFLFDILFN